MKGLRECMETMIILVEGHWLIMRRAASMPESSGMAISRMTKSGCKGGGLLHGLTALAASPPPGTGDRG